MGMTINESSFHCTDSQPMLKDGIWSTYRQALSEDGGIVGSGSSSQRPLCQGVMKEQLIKSRMTIRSWKIWPCLSDAPKDGVLQFALKLIDGQTSCRQ